MMKRPNIGGRATGSGGGVESPGEDRSAQRLELEIELARLRSHEKHMAYIYGVRLGGLALSGLTIFIGAIMVFLGLQGSFDWAVEAPHTLQAKLTNASPGIVFATAGMFLGLVVVMQKPVGYSIGGRGRSRASSIGLHLGR